MKYLSRFISKRFVGLWLSFRPHPTIQSSMVRSWDDTCCVVSSVLQMVMVDVEYVEAPATSDYNWVKTVPPSALVGHILPGFRMGYSMHRYAVLQVLTAFAILMSNTIVFQTQSCVTSSDIRKFVFFVCVMMWSFSRGAREPLLPLDCKVFCAWQSISDRQSSSGPMLSMPSNFVQHRVLESWESHIFNQDALTASEEDKWLSDIFVEFYMESHHFWHMAIQMHHTISGIWHNFRTQNGATS